MEDHEKAEDNTTVNSSVDCTNETTEESETQKEESECLESEIQPEVSELESSEVSVDTAASSDNIESTAMNIMCKECIIDKDDHEEAEDEDQIEVDAAAIEKLTNGVLEMFLPNLQKSKGSLNEMLHNQEVLIETVQQENSKFTDSAAMRGLVDMMQEARRYHSKLVNLKREMNALTEKSAKLKRRAVKIQQQKQKEELTRADQIERERERERMLTAKVAKLPKDQKE